MLNLVYFDLISFKKALLTFKCKININIFALQILTN